MRRRALIRSLVALALVALAATAGAGAVGAVSSPGLPAQVVSITRPTSLNTYATADYSKRKTGTTTWRFSGSCGSTSFFRRRTKQVRRRCQWMRSSAPAPWKRRLKRRARS